MFAKHGNCDKYFCKDTKKEENVVSEIPQCGFKNYVLACLQSVLNISTSILMNKNINAA